MRALLVSLVSVVVGASLASATVVGLVQQETKPPAKSPVNVDNPTIQYGETNSAN